MAFPAALAAAAASGDLQGCVHALHNGGGIPTSDVSGAALWSAAGAESGDQLCCVELLIFAGANVEHTAGEHDHTPLHQAGEKGNTEVAEALLAKGAAIDAKTDDGKTPLHWASLNGHTATAEALLDKGAAIEAKSNDGYTPLHGASQNGHTATAEALLDKGAAIDAKTYIGNAPLHFASTMGHTATAEALIDKGAVIEAKTNTGHTPLHCASMMGHTDTVTALLDKGAAIDAKTNDGNTPLHWASHDGQTATVEALLAKGAAVEAKTNDGDTPLHWASREGHAGTVTALLDHGADIAVKLPNGKTAHALATGEVKTNAVLMARLKPNNPKRKREREPAAAAAQAASQRGPKAHKTACPVGLQALAYAKSLGLPDAVCFNHEHDRCYCGTCYPAEYPSTLDDASGSTYVVPRGWFRVGIAAERRWALIDIFNKWSVSYHGVKSTVVLKSIFEHGTFMIPGDTLLDGTVLRSGRSAGRQDDGVFYTSPTVRYAGLKFCKDLDTLRPGRSNPPSLHHHFRVLYEYDRLTRSHSLPAQTPSPRTGPPRTAPRCRPLSCSSAARSPVRSRGRARPWALHGSGRVTSVARVRTSTSARSSGCRARRKGPSLTAC